MENYPEVTILNEEFNEDNIFQWVDKKIVEWIDQVVNREGTYKLQFPLSISKAVRREIRRLCGRIRMHYIDEEDSPFVMIKKDKSKLKLSQIKSVTETYQKKIDAYPKGVTQVLDYLYIGSIKDAGDLDLLKSLNIGKIINVTIEGSSFFPDEFEYLRIAILDRSDQEIRSHFEQCFEFIKNRNGKNVLVHCMFGKSRSASVIIAYLMKYYNKTLKESFYHLYERRKIKPNSSFMKALIELEKDLFNKTTMEIDEWIKIVGVHNG